MRVIEIRVLISHIQNLNDCRQFVVRQYPNKNIFLENNLPQGAVVEERLQYNISESCLPSDGNTLYVEI